eukprot:5188431-Prymnesium_polylepis.1
MPGHLASSWSARLRAPRARPSGRKLAALRLREAGNESSVRVVRISPGVWERRGGGRKGGKSRSSPHTPMSGAESWDAVCDESTPGVGPDARESGRSLMSTRA